MVGVGRFGLYNVYRTIKERGEITYGACRSIGRGKVGVEWKAARAFLRDMVMKYRDAAPRPHNDRSIALEGGSVDKIN